MARGRIVPMRNETWGLPVDVPPNFGDTGGEWVEGRVVVWEALERQIKLTPPARIDDALNRGWWLGLADLFCFGTGSLDLAEDLKTWRENNYDSPSLVLKFIRNNWGNSVAFLELYLWLNENVRKLVYIHNYQNQYGIEPREHQLDSPAADLIAEVVSVAQSSLRSEIDIQLAQALFDDPKGDLAQIRSGGWDEAHFSPHYSFDWSIFELSLSKRDVLTVNSELARISVATYAGWYRKLHEVRREFELDPDTAGDVDSIEVEVAGIGIIGKFTYLELIGAYILEENTIATDSLVISPRFGFKLTHDMSKILEPLLPDYDQWEDEPLEHVELHVRQEVDLAHSLTYEISSEDNDSNDWTRINGKWQEGFMIPEGKHHKRCTLALVEGDHLDSSLTLHEAVLNDSSIYEVSPWAINIVTRLWDLYAPVFTAVGELSEMNANDDVLRSDLKGIFLSSLDSYIDSLSSFIQADESFLVEDLMEWREGQRLTAQQLLEAIAAAESERNEKAS